MLYENDMSGNIGEWSELYTFLKLLAQGRVNAADDRAVMINNVYYPINKIIREEEIGSPIEYVINGNFIDVKFDGINLMSVDRTEMNNVADNLLEELMESHSRSFELENIKEYANGIRVMKLKAPSTQTTDILMQLHDINTDMDRTVGFSIKSEIGSPPSLINASGATKFRYEVTGIDEDCAEHINSINTRRKLIDRMHAIREEGEITYFRPVNDVFERNMRLEDGDMARIIAEALLIAYEGERKACADVIDRLGEIDPIGYGETLMYESKFKRFLSDSALGMRPATQWDGNNEANGGYIIVKKDGSIVAYTLYDMDAFKKYLYEWTYFDRPSMSRHKYMELFTEDGKMFFDLVLQVRFFKSPEE